MPACAKINHRIKAWKDMEGRCEICEGESRLATSAQPAKLPCILL